MITAREKVIAIVPFLIQLPGFGPQQPEVIFRDRDIPVRIEIIGKNTIIYGIFACYGVGIFDDIAHTDIVHDGIGRIPAIINRGFQFFFTPQ